MKIMIVDDEKWVRATIKAIIPFEKIGMTLACEASNGIEALELCRQNKPDILLTDIMMPGLTGLDLIKEMRSCLPDVRIAVISGYNDFEYAKTAMKYGISDYLLKPVDENELLQVLMKFKNEISEESRLADEKLQEKERYRLALPVIYEALLNRIISQNSLTAEKIRTELSKYGINFINRYYSIMVFSPDDVQEFESRERAVCCMNCIKRVMKRYFGAVTFANAENTAETVSIINHEGPSMEKIQEAFTLCSQIIKKRFDTTLSAGLSLSTRQQSMLQQAHLEARKALESRFWSGPGKFSRYSQGILSEDINIQLTEDVLNKIILNLKLSNIRTADSYIGGVCSALRQQDNINPGQVREFFWQLIQSVISVLNIQMPFIRHETLFTGEQPYERIKRTIFLDQLEDYTKDILQRIFNFYHDKNPVSNINLIDNAKKVIEGNYAGDISLEQVAGHIHLSPAYLSELFKKETGMSFIDYKTIVRLDNAKRLLDTTNMNINDISERVGYSDPKYFSKLFKKITGKTLYEYRKESRGRPQG